MNSFGFFWISLRSQKEFDKKTSNDDNKNCCAVRENDVCVCVKIK